MQVISKNLLQTFGAGEVVEVIKACDYHNFLDVYFTIDTPNPNYGEIDVAVIHPESGLEASTIMFLPEPGEYRLHYIVDRIKELLVSIEAKRVTDSFSFEPNNDVF